MCDCYSYYVAGSKLTFLNTTTFDGLSTLKHLDLEMNEIKTVDYLGLSCLETLNLKDNKVGYIIFDTTKFTFCFMWLI